MPAADCAHKGTGRSYLEWFRVRNELNGLMCATKKSKQHMEIELNLGLPPTMPPRQYNKTIEGVRE